MLRGAAETQMALAAGTHRFLLFFEAGSYYVAHHGLELIILLFIRLDIQHPS
jgi:hypothetical protein